MKPLFAAPVIAFAILGATAWQPAALAQQALAAQSTAARGVTVKVTPQSLSPAGWEFAVVLDTHSEDLKDDLEKTAVLVVNGEELRPVQWQGAPAGGHHRQGVLRFPAPATQAGVVELKLARPGEATPRVYRWEGLQAP